MSGLAEGSSPRLSGVVHFLTMVEKDGQEVPFEVAPAARWAVHCYSNDYEADGPLEETLFEEVKRHVASMVWDNLFEVPNWSDCTSLHFDVVYTDSEGKRSEHQLGGVYKLFVTQGEEGFHGALVLGKSPHSGRELRNLLYHLWDKEDDQLW